MLIKYSCATGVGGPPQPRWRQQAINRLHRAIDRQRASLAYQLLREALWEGWQIDDEGPWGFGAEGKPYLLQHPDIHFNLSHCPEAAACVVANHPVGIDVESIPCELDIELLEHIFHPEECGLILHAAKPTEEFARLWTRKESYLKYLGCGLVEQLPHLFYPMPLCHWQSQSDAGAQFALSVCTPSEK